MSPSLPSTPANPENPFSSNGTSDNSGSKNNTSGSPHAPRLSLDDLYSQKSKALLIDTADKKQENSTAQKEGENISEKQRKDGENASEDALFPFPQRMEKNSLAHSFFHMGLALATITVLIFISLILSGISISGNEEDFAFIENRTGEVLITDDFSGKEVAVETTVPIFEKATIQTGASAEAVLHFPFQGEVRTNGSSRLSFKNKNGTPQIFLEEGNIWVFAPDTIEVHTHQYSFFVDAGSTSFSKQKDRVVVKTWGNSMKTLLNNGEVEITVPMLSRAVFPETQTQYLSTETLQKLHFSKLLKEFSMSVISLEDGDTAYLSKDELLSEKWSEKILATQAVSGSVWEKIKSSFSLFSLKKHQNAFQNWQKKKQYLLSLLQTTNENDARLYAQKNIKSQRDVDKVFQEFLTDASIASWKIEDLLRDMKLIEQYVIYKHVRHDVEDTLLTRFSPSDRIWFHKTVLRNAFRGLQKAFTIQDKEWRDTELARIRDIWDVEIKNKNTNISTALITVDRENLFRLFVKNPKEVNETLLDFLQFLDDTEIALALEETNNTTLEIIHKDLVLANGFLNANQPQLARNILEKSESLLETIQLSPEEVIVQNVVRQKESLFTKLLACESFGACGDTEFSEWFQKQKIIACQIENACNAEMFEKWLTALLDTNLKASAEIDPRNFLEEEYEHPEERALSLLESEAMVLEDGSPSEEVGFFDIHKATTGSGFTFSGKLSLKHSYLKEITLDDGTEILGTIALHSLEQVIYRTRVPEQNSGATIEGDYDNISEDSPDAIQSSLSPAVIDIIVRAIQPKFLDAGLIVFRSDIIPISSTKGVVQHALVGPEKTAVSFEYTATDDSTIEVLKNVVLKEYPSISLPEVSLEEAEEKIIELATWEKEKGRLVFDSLKLLEREGFIVQKEKLTALVEKETVVFSDVYDEKNNLTLVGEISPSSFIFLKVADTTGIWSFENISVNQYSSLVNSPQNTEELSEEGSDPEAETDSTPESEEQVSAE